MEISFDRVVEHSGNRNRLQSPKKHCFSLSLCDPSGGVCSLCVLTFVRCTSKCQTNNLSSPCRVEGIQVRFLAHSCVSESTYPHGHHISRDGEGAMSAGAAIA